LKAPSSLLADGGEIVLPPESQRVDYEGELALVIGRRIKDWAPERYLEALAGVCCANDVTARDLQKKDKQFARAKSFDTFCPVGPAIVAGLDPSDLAIETRVNGTIRQSARTSAMVFSPASLIAYISRMMTLHPGDLILTGTPAGVGPLSPGDLVEIEIEGVGVLSNRVAGS
jgi:2-keto-4-pentenoate hydratase/2-oxohepta-3-ene-1,7-dioic acid hydratase in catechol pathway